MKKSMMTLAALLTAVALTSCSNDSFDEKTSLLTPSNQEILFSTGVQTRGAAFTSSDPNSVTPFKVFAYQHTGGASYINGGVITWDGTKTAYVPDNTYYWPESGSLDFLAVYPSDVTFATVPSAYNSFAYTASTTIGNQVDLMVATATNLSKTDGNVALAFSHLLSQISVQAKVSTNLQVEISDVTFHNLQPTGTFDGTVLSASGTVTNYSISMASPQTLTQAGGTVDLTGTNVLLLIPQTVTAWDKTGTASTNTTNSYITATIAVKSADGGTTLLASGDVYFPVAIAWTAGKHYTYTLNFGDATSPTANGVGYQDNGSDVTLTGATKITFSTTVTGWDDVAVPVTF